MRDKSLKVIVNLIILTLMAVLLVGQTAVSHAQTNSEKSAAADLANALQNIHNSARYTFVTDLIQTEHPGPRLENIGRQDKTTRLQIEGDMNRPEQTTQLTLTADRGGATQVSALKVVEGVVYEQQADQSWQKVQEGVDLFAPNGNPLEFLNSATDIAYTSDDSLYPAELLPPDVNSITRISFNIDSQAFGAALQKQAIEQLTAQNQWRPGMTTQIGELYARMTGVGEVWFTEAGLPLRQIIELEMPADNGDTVSARLTTDFSDWEAMAEVPVSAKVVSLPPAQAASVVGYSTYIITTLSIVLASLFLSRSRPFYRVLVTVLIASFVLTPFLQSVQAADTQAIVNQLQNAAATTEAESTPELPGLQKPEYHPLQNPLSRQQPLLKANNAPTAVLTQTYTTGTDTDGDGLNDEIEIYKLGTNPGSVDSDGDRISDLVEVTGFEVNGVTWYLDPLSGDSNGDSLPDNLECVERVDVDRDGNLINAVPTPCGDNDGDGIPDVYDYDDDNDLVPDAVDASPAYTGGASQQSQTMFDYNLAGFMVDNPVELTIEIRPTEEAHLYLSNNVYDWPSQDTEGQITRVFNDTLYDNNVDYEAAKNGDIMVAPELEITIPWDAANPTRGLPVSATVTINASTPLGTWLDQGLLNEYGIQARLDADGTVVLKTPLYDVRDSIGDRVVAWNTQIPYVPQTAVWGANHQARLAWTVIGLIDRCDPAQAPIGVSAATFCDPSQTANWQTETSILHTYYEPFFVTGFSAAEDFGLDVALMAEDDSLTTTYESDLWHLADSLQAAYIKPKTLGDGSRFDIGDIVARFQDGSTATATERWGIAANALTVSHLTYTNTIVGVNDMAEVATGTFLSSTYPTAVNNDITSLLILQEQQNRTISLADGDTTFVTFITGTNTIAVNFTNVETQTVSSLYSRPFHYTTADGWSAYKQIDPYIAALETAVTPLLTDANLDTAVGSGIMNYPAVRAAALGVLKTHYLGLYTGKHNVVDIGGTLIGDSPLDDNDYQLDGNDPLLQVVTDTIRDLFLLSQAATIYVIDGQTISLTGYEPVTDLVLYTEELGKLLLDQQNGELFGWRARRAASGFVAATIAFVWQFALNYYDFAQSSTGFAIGYGSTTFLILGIGFYTLGFVFEKTGVASNTVYPLMTTAYVLFTVYSVIEAARAVAQIKHYQAAKQLITLAQLVDNAQLAKPAIRFAHHTVKSITRAAKIAAIVGLFVDVFVEAAFFVFTVIYYKLEVGSVAYNEAVARFIGGITVAFVVFALTLALIAAIGAPIAAFLFIVLAIFEAVFALACYVDKREPDDFFCKGITGTVAKAIADALYEYTVPINISRSDRLSINVQSTELTDPVKGFTPGNGVTLTLAITNTQYPKPPSWPYSIGSFGSQTYHNSVPASFLQRSAFAYYVSSTETSAPPNNLQLGTQLWIQQPDGSSYKLKRGFTATGVTTLPAAGLNKSVSLYMHELGALPLLSCWSIVAQYQCEEKLQRFSNPSYLGNLAKFDVLPATFAEFVALTPLPNGGVRMAWDNSFPTLYDGDGDGLLSKASPNGGTDPDDSTIDADGDGLTDVWEMNNSFDPLQADADNDNLSDYWEVFYGTNPLAADTDADGLLDGEEVFHPDYHAASPDNTNATWSGGWQIVYDYEGTVPQVTAVTASPKIADTDGDLNSDQYEYIYKFNPRAPYSIDPLKVESADIAASPEYEYMVRAGASLNYNVTVKSNLDTILQSRGLFEAELPEDNVQHTLPFTITGQQTLTMSGSLYASPGAFPTTTGTNMTIRAGAYTQDVNPTPTETGLVQVLPMNTADVYGTLHDVSGNNFSGKCALVFSYDPPVVEYICPDWNNGYPQFTENDSVWSTQVADLPGSFSVSYWVLPNQSFATDRRLFSMNGFDGTYRVDDVVDTRVAANGTTIYVDLKVGGTDCTNASTVRLTAAGNQQLVWGQWNHVVLTKDDLGTTTLYVNGQASTPLATPDLCDSLSSWAFGSVGHIYGNTTFTGGIRDAVVYSRTLSALEVQQETAVGFYPLIDFRFDEPPSSNRYTENLKPNFFADCNDNYWGSPCPFGGLPGLSNQAVLFRDNGNGGFNLNDTLAMSGDASAYGFGNNTNGSGNYDVPFTIMGWIKGVNWNGTRDLLVADRTSSCPFACTRFGFQDGHPYMTFFNQNTFQQETFTATTTLATNQWYHVAWQRDKGSNMVRIFVDGVEVMAQSAPNFWVPSNSHFVLGGNYHNDFYENYHGWLDNFLMTPIALTGTEIQNTMRQVPLLNLHLDEDYNEGAFYNSNPSQIDVTCTNCPAAGARGQMREAPVFEKDDFLTLGGADLSELNTSDYAITLWVQPSFQLTTKQMLVQHNGYELALTDELKVSFCDGSTQTTITDNILGVNRWQHVAVVYVAGTPTIFLNGQPAAATTTAVPGNCSGSVSQIGGGFIGQLDEISIYAQALLESHIEQQYEYQARWFDSRIRPNILVDNDPPVIDIQPPAPYMNSANGQQILFTAVDSGVGLEFQVDHYLRDPYGTYFYLTNTPTGMVTDTTYIATIPDGALGREGTYTVSFWAYDRFWLSDYMTKTFIVDHQYPDADLNPYEGVIAVTDRVTLTGIIADNLSGLNTSSVRVRLLENGVAATNYYSATVSGNQWQAVIPFDSPPYGTYKVQMLAQDNVGNQLDRVFYYDRRLSGFAPQTNLLLPTSVITSGNTTIHGIVQTLPYPDNPKVYLPWETAVPFADASSNNYSLTCTNCPTTGANGQFGKAATFGPNTSIQITEAMTATKGTLMLWFKPTWSAGSNGYDPILATSGANTLLIDDDLQTITLNNGITSQTMPFTMTTGIWHHLAIVSDDVTWTAYLDGTALDTITQTVHLGLPLTIGAAANGVTGVVDEVVLYEGALQPYQLYDLAHPLDIGVTQTAVSPRALETGVGTWRTATLAQPYANFSTWSYTLPDIIEGPYQLDLRSTDAHGVQSTIGPVWNGIIDTKAPDVALSANFTAGQVEVGCSATDQYMSETGWSCPLAAGPTQTYETAAWFVNAFSTTTHLVGLHNGPGSIPLQDVTMTACDTFGQCTSDLITLPGDGGVDSIFEIDEYALVYQLDVPANGDYNGALPAYTIDRSAQVSNFDRVAYYLELDDGPNREWVYVSMDAFSSDTTQIGVPVATLFEQNVTNLNVVSNVPGVAIGGPFPTGNIEFWHHCYDPTADSGLGGSSSLFDIDDTVTIASPNCDGSMQIHQGGNTLLAWNGWDSADPDDIGIGNSDGAHPDWTDAGNSGDWITRTLYVLARPVAAAVSDVYTVTPGVPLTIPAPGVLANDENVITATAVTSPSHGTLHFQPDGSFTYEMTEDASSDSFVYRVTDGYFLQQEATVTLNRTDATCLVETNGDNVTDGASADASALRTAVQAAAPGATIKVAGTCAGISGDRVLTVDKELTLLGGYQATDWLALAQPTMYRATLDAQSAGMTLVISDTGDLTASGLIITNGSRSAIYTYWDGASIRNLGRLALSDSVVSNNHHASGGYAIFNEEVTGWMTLTNTAVLSNTGGGILNHHELRIVDSLIAHNDEEAVDNYSPFSGPPARLTIINSVLRDNVGFTPLNNAGEATISNSAVVGNTMVGLGAAAISNRGTMTMTNSTISGNTNLGVDTGGYGGSAGFRNWQDATIQYSTIVNNTTPNTNNTSGLRNNYFYSDPGSLTLYATVVAGNTNTDGLANCGAQNVSAPTWPPTYDYTFALAAGSHNLGNDNSCNVSGFTIADPLLLPLADPAAENAAELAHDMQAGSPLIDAVPNGTVNCGSIINRDQRGIIRPIDGSCDIGAAEFTPDTTPPTITITQYLTETTGSTPMFTGLITDSSGIALSLLQIVPNSGTPLNFNLSLTGDAWSYLMDQPYGSYNFYVEATDNYGNTAVSGPHPFVYTNQTPVAVDDAYLMTEGATSLTAVPGVLDNDSDAYGDALTAISLTPPGNGALSLNLDGTFVYTPTPGFHGSDTFTYQASDAPSGNSVQLPFDNGTGLIATNMANNQTNGTLVNGATWTTDTPPTAYANPYAIQFDGSDDYVQITDHPSLDLTTFSVGGWVNISQFKTDWQPLITKEDSTGAQRNFGLFIVPNSAQIHYSFQENCSIWHGYNSVNSLSLNSWHHIMMTYDGSQFNLYLDGELDSSQPLIATPCQNNEPLKIGKEQSVFTPFAGKMDDVRVYNHALAVIDIQRLVGGLVDTGTVTVTVPAPNSAPIANANTYTTTEDAILNITIPGVLNNDTDVDGDTLTAVLNTNVTSGSLTFNSNGSFTYQPDTNYCGSDSFTYHANDSEADSNMATVTLNVTCVNDVPAAIADNYTVLEDGSLNIAASGILTNDVDVEGDLLTAVLETNVNNGSLSLNSNGAFVYTPTLNYCGSDSFTYHAYDGQAGSNTATVSLDVTCTNDAPTAADDSYTTVEDVPLTITAAGVLTNDIDIDGDMVTAVLDTSVTTGTLTFNSDGSFTYTPPPNWYGVATFTYHAHDGSLESNTAVVTLTIISDNQIPIAAADSYTTTEEIVLSVADPGVLDNDVDDDGDSLTAVLDSNVTSGTLSLSSDGAFIYTPTANFCGTDNFSYHSHDGEADSNGAIVTLTVTCVNDAPTAVADVYSVLEDSVSSLDILANDSDVDGDALNVTALTTPSNGTAIISGTLAVYTPNPNFVGSDVFTYTISDGSLTDTAIVTISVDNDNDTPTAVDDTYTINEDSSNSLAVLDNDSDIDVGDSLSVTAVSMPNNGTAVISGTIILYTPNPDFFGTDIFSYTISDGQLTDTAFVTVAVNAVNDAPTAVDDTYTVNQNSNDNVLTILANDSDIEGDSLTIVSVSGGENGTAVISGTTILYTPAPDFVGADMLTYSISDGELIATATITIGVIQIDTAFTIYLPFVTKP